MAPSCRPSLPLALLVILCTMLLPPLGGAMSENHDVLMLGKFHRWMSVHNRSYPSAAEKLRRFEVYSRNVKYIEATNMNGGLGYGLGENEFTDLTSEEFRARYTGGKFTKTAGSAIVGDPVITTLAGPVHERRETMEEKDVLRIPDNFDWREKGAVTPAKNQIVGDGDCGSCWAFAVLAVLEAQNKMKTGELLDLSEQELVDCDDRDYGCIGGYAEDAFEWIKRQGGVVTEAAYPYVGYQGYCRMKEISAVRVGKITEIVLVVERNEQALAEAVLRTPVAVGVSLRDINLQHYANGIYKGPCSGRGWDVDHAVAVVGFGETAGEKYWIIKNSWGQTWGEEGFLRMLRGYESRYGLCGIALEPYYALI